jgi:prepilin-type N-terminal cleavage/methylation domain-containing protein
MTPKTLSGLRKKGFTLVELLIVVAIIAILAAIAVPMYGKYIRKARTSEAITNLGAISLYEETFFSENDRYQTAGPSPATVPKSSNPGGRLPFDTSVSGWIQLGRAIPNDSKVYFQYEVRAGQLNSAGVDVTTNSLVGYAATGVAPGGTSCSPALATLSAQALVIPPTASSNWFYATAVGDQNSNGICSLFIKVIDRTDVAIIGNEIE